MRSDLPLIVYRICSNKRPGRLFQDRSWKRSAYSRGVLIPKLDGKTMIKKIVMLNYFAINDTTCKCAAPLNASVVWKVTYVILLKLPTVL